MATYRATLYRAHPDSPETLTVRSIEDGESRRQALSVPAHEAEGVEPEVLHDLDVPVALRPPQGAEQTERARGLPVQRAPEGVDARPMYERGPSFLRSEEPVVRYLRGGTFGPSKPEAPPVLDPRVVDGP